MENKVLIKELNNTNNGNKIFNRQRRYDLIELVDYVNDNKALEIAVDLQLEDWFMAAPLIRSQYDEAEQLERCDKYLALKILEKMQYKNKRLKQIDVQQYLLIYESHDEKMYQQAKDKMMTTKELLKIIELENIKLNRIHFVLIDIASDTLCDTLAQFLENDSPISTSIYVFPGEYLSDTIPNSKEIKYIWDEYEYEVFNWEETGVMNIPKNKRTNKVMIKK